MPNKAPTDFEPLESMYPIDNEKLHFTKHQTIWQAHVYGGQDLFFEAKTAEEAYHSAKCILGVGFQLRRLPLTHLKERATQ